MHYVNGLFGLLVFAAIFFGVLPLLFLSMGKIDGRIRRWRVQRWDRR
jgi:hypothetical protein